MCTPSRLLRGRKLIDGVPVALFSMYFFASLSRWKGFFVPINQKHTIKGALIHESVQKNKQTFAPTTRVIAKPRNFWENSEKPSFASCIFGPHYLRHAFRKRSFDLFGGKKKKKERWDAGRPMQQHERADFHETVLVPDTANACTTAIDGQI